MADKETMEMGNMEEAKTVAAEFQADRTQLKKAVQRAVKTIGGSKSESPILSSIFLSLEGDELNVYGTDMKSAYSTDIEVRGDKDGYAAVPGRVFSEVVNALPKGEKNDMVNIKWDDNGQVTINTPGYKYQINAIQADYSQYIMRIEEGVQFVISGAVLNDLVSMVAPAVGNDEYRPNLMVARMEVEDDKIRLVGTDSRRLAMIERKLDDSTDKIEAHILGKGLKDLASFIQSDEVITVTIDTTGKLASFVSGQTTVFVRLMETNYPAYGNSIPDEGDFVVDVEGKKLLECIEGVMPMAKNMNHIVHLEIKKDGIKIKSDGDDQGLATVEMKAINEIEGNLNISFNGRYLLEAIKEVSFLNLRLTLGKKLSPMKIQQIDNPDNFTWVIMPIRPA